jgi:hypothetical protein
MGRRHRSLQLYDWAHDAFAELDTTVCGTVCFGDGSVVRIEGCGTVVLSSRAGEYRVFTGIYYIPKLKTSILSVGQLDELGYDIRVKSGLMRVWDTEGRWLARIPRAPNRLYVLYATPAQSVCYLARAQEEAWRWHARLGHLGFQALKKMASQQMVNGLPRIEQIDQLCDGCLMGKHRRMPFLEKAEYRSKQGLELVHGDLCGPINLPTPSGKKYFLLMVGDHSRYMWLVLLPSKDCAAEAIKKVQAEAESVSGKKPRCLRTDRGVSSFQQSLSSIVHSRVCSVS